MDPLTIGLWLVGQIVVGAAIWGGIRAEIRAIHKNQDELRADVNATNQRLDRHLEASGLHTREVDR